ncbi:MAG: methyltransferase domain-containing protein, partial [Burkholderiales bacterium]
AAYEAVPRGTASRSLVTRLIPSPSINLASRRTLLRLRGTLRRRGARKVLVLGGGRQRKWLDPLMSGGTPDGLQLTYTDIDHGADVDLFCDAHELPFLDASQDAVITTAVLEHVMYPERAAAEIHRVLRVGGLLYSEMPFMQQVHEGAYDFTRYTLSGHRRLFNRFDEIDSGMVAGPATALVWAIENFALAFVSRPRLRQAVKALVRIAAGWIKYLDRLLMHNPQAMDGASCTYFLGSKVDTPIPDSEIVARYVGAKHLQHS